MNNKSTIIIAEAGVNHNGDFTLAKELIDVAALSGADAIKFQTFDTKMVMTRSAVKAKYQLNTAKDSQSQFDMVKKLELPFKWHYDLLDHCKAQNIKFLSTPFDKYSLDFLADEILLDILKIPSGEITNGPFLLECALKKGNIILSTGMSYLGEVEKAISWIYEIWNTMVQKPQLSVLHCVSSYPARIEDVNLRAIKAMEMAFRFPVGYSDHTIGAEIALAAVAMGAKVIEKHFTLDREMEGPDHKASLEPEELEAMITAIRNVELAMGDGIKKPTKSEKPNIEVARKSIVAARPIHTGELFCTENLSCKRPATGLSPMLWDKIVGIAAKKDYVKDEPIEI